METIDRVEGQRLQEVFALDEVKEELADGPPQVPRELSYSVMGRGRTLLECRSLRVPPTRVAAVLKRNAPLPYEKLCHRSANGHLSSPCALQHLEVVLGQLLPPERHDQHPEETILLQRGERSAARETHGLDRLALRGDDIHRIYKPRCCSSEVHSARC